MDLATVLWALFAFQLKHFLCDFVLQSKFQVDTKKIYGHYGGFIHAGFHALGSLPIVYVASGSVLVTAIICIGELVLHYHVDWSKAQVDAWGGWTEKDQGVLDGVRDGSADPPAHLSRHRRLSGGRALTNAL